MNEHKCVNVPGAYAPYGKEIRSLFTVPQGSYFLGVDLDGIESRILCHYCYNYKGGKEFTELVLDGDFHTANAKLWKVSRNTAKSILYAMMYSAGPTKLGELAGGSTPLGRKMKKAFLKANPAYNNLLTDLERVYENRGHLIGLDGRKIRIRQKRKLLNSLIQSAGSVIAKKWMVLVDEELKGKGLIDKVKQIIFMHDELNFEVKGNSVFVKEVKKLVEECAITTGLLFNLNVKIEATGLIGTTWYECH